MLVLLIVLLLLLPKLMEVILLLVLVRIKVYLLSGSSEVNLIMDVMISDKYRIETRSCAISLNSILYSNRYFLAPSE